MNASIFNTRRVKRCELKSCGARINPSNYTTLQKFADACFCSRPCAANSRGKVDWDALMAYEVLEGETMTFDEIAKVAGTSRQCVQQCAEQAFRRLAKKLEVLSLRKDLDP